MRVACLWFQERAPLEKLAESFLRFSPQICLRQDQALFIEIGKCRHLYSEDGFQARAQVLLRRFKRQAQIGLGNDITDSLLIAKFGQFDFLNLPLPALLEVADPFQRDPVLRKMCGKMVAAFEDLGVATLKHFLNLPAAELSSRFGATGLLCQQRLRGDFQLPWPNWKPTEEIFEKTEFSYFEFYGELTPILFELKRQLDLIFSRLWARALKAQSLNVTVFCEKTSFETQPNRSFHFDFLIPQGTTKGCLNILKERLERDFQKNPIRSPIEGLECRVLSTVPNEHGQKSLLHNREETAEQLAALLGQLAEVHGRDGIFRAELTEERLPEKSWIKRHDLKTPAKSVSVEGRIPLRPTYLMKPERVEVTGGSVHIRRKAFRIRRWLEGVERLTGGWMESTDPHLASYDRNYYRVELENDVVLSLFQTPNQDYFLHGYFG